MSKLEKMSEHISDKGKQLEFMYFRAFDHRSVGSRAICLKLLKFKRGITKKK